MVFFFLNYFFFQINAFLFLFESIKYYICGSNPLCPSLTSRKSFLISCSPFTPLKSSFYIYGVLVEFFVSKKFNFWHYIRKRQKSRRFIWENIFSNLRGIWERNTEITSFQFVWNWNFVSYKPIRFRVRRRKPLWNFVFPSRAINKNIKCGIYFGTEVDVIHQLFRYVPMFFVYFMTKTLAR